MENLKRHLPSSLHNAYIEAVGRIKSSDIIEYSLTGEISINETADNTFEIYYSSEKEYLPDLCILYQYNNLYVPMNYNKKHLMKDVYDVMKYIFQKLP